MTPFGNRRAALEAVDFVESHFPNAHAHPPTSSSRRPPQPETLLSPPGIPADEYQRGRLSGAPPGLVRVCPPTFAPTRVLNNGNVSLFSDFARYLDDGLDENNHRVELDLTCVICMEHKLQVPECVRPRSQSSEEGPLEWLATLPCGHYMGSDCLEKWLVESGLESEDGITRCPLCRLSLVYLCGHFIAPREYNPMLYRAEQVPLTLPEGGGIPRLCEICYKGNVHGAIDRLRHLLFPPIFPDDFRFRNSAEILRHTAERFTQRVWDFWGTNIHYNRW
ncbi:hypothetical protein F4823DRAFT_640616 [Ustulina deusta]|nr:hypothetical protein F4823DRAFT_640616 [Ustulina deusta]